jgi:hypothetical protein
MQSKTGRRHTNNVDLQISDADKSVGGYGLPIHNYTCFRGLDYQAWRSPDFLAACSVSRNGQLVLLSRAAIYNKQGTLVVFLPGGRRQFDRTCMSDILLPCEYLSR